MNCLFRKGNEVFCFFLFFLGEPCFQGQSILYFTNPYAFTLSHCRVVSPDPSSRSCYPSPEGDLSTIQVLPAVSFCYRLPTELPVKGKEGCCCCCLPPPPLLLMLMFLPLPLLMFFNKQIFFYIVLTCTALAVNASNTSAAFSSQLCNLWISSGRSKEEMDSCSAVNEGYL